MVSVHWFFILSFLIHLILLSSHLHIILAIIIHLLCIHYHYPHHHQPINQPRHPMGVSWMIHFPPGPMSPAVDLELLFNCVQTSEVRPTQRASWESEAAITQLMGPMDLPETHSKSAPWKSMSWMKFPFVKDGQMFRAELLHSFREKNMFWKIWPYLVLRFQQEVLNLEVAKWPKP